MKAKLEYRIQCLVDTLHWETIKDLLKTSDIIMLPEFKIKNMTQGLKKSKQNRMLYCLKFYQFKSRLISKCFNHKKLLFIIDESFSTKTCSHCNFENKKQKDRKFLCSKCNFLDHRDVNATRNLLKWYINKSDNLILTKNIDSVFVNTY